MKPLKINRITPNGVDGARKKNIPLEWDEELDKLIRITYKFPKNRRKPKVNEVKRYGC